MSIKDNRNMLFHFKFFCDKKHCETVQVYALRASCSLLKFVGNIWKPVDIHSVPTCLIMRTKKLIAVCRISCRQNNWKVRPRCVSKMIISFNKLDIFLQLFNSTYVYIIVIFAILRFVEICI